MTQEIKLVGGGVALVDDDAVELIGKFKWRLQVDQRGVRYAVYRTRKHGQQIHIQMHRFILGLTDGIPLVDHQNGDGLDNRRENLRVATVSQNQANVGLRSDNVSGFKGVCWLNRERRWLAFIQVNGRRIRLGRYQGKVDAAIAYDLAAIRFFGGFARTNVIENPVAL